MAPERAITSQEENILVPVMSVPASPVAGTPAQNAQSPISILLAVAQCQSRSDDDLTNLNWLHERDLLKGMNINPSPSNSVNSTPDKGDNNNSSTDSSLKEYSEVSDSSTNFYNSASLSPNHATAAPRNKHPHNVAYDPSIHVDNKPPYSFSCLIFMAIEDSAEKALPVKEIYAWIVDHFPYFKNAPMGWKNSIRHNLSLNKCFRKMEKASNLGKGSLWTIDPQYKPTLIQALNRSLINPMSNPNSSPRLLDIFLNKSSTYRSPNPDLFPYLARELAASETKKLNQKDETLEAVDAAAVMLSLKNGQSSNHRRGVQQVFNTLPSQDHTYSAADSMTFVKEDHEAAECANRVPRKGTCRKLDFEDEEDRKIKEGAETLLNLAGVTLRRNHFDLNDDTKEFHKKLKTHQHFDINKNETKEETSTLTRLVRVKKRITKKIAFYDISEGGEHR